VPAALQRAFQDNGGLVLGAFEGPSLIGFTLGFLGREGSALFHYSHMTAVRPERQDHHVGFSLKLAQRAEVLKTDLSEIRWTFDPLQSRNAWFNVRRLGGTPDRYHPRYYGEMRDAINAGLETDRIRLVWSLDSPRVRERVRGIYPSPAEDESRCERSPAWVTTKRGNDGLRRPKGVNVAEAPEVRIEVPYDLGRLRERDPSLLRDWRASTRSALETAFAQGYRVDDFVVTQSAGERRSFYLLKRSAGMPERTDAR